MQHHRAGELSKAEGIYQQILKTDPNQPVALHLLGVIAHQQSKYDIAVKLITKALAINPDFAEAHNNLGNAFTELGKLDEAVASCHKALAIKPDLAEAHNNLGTALKELGKLDEAVTSYRKALAINHDFVEAHYNLGNAFIKLGKLDEAVASFHKTLAIEPNFVEAHINLGAALKELGRMEEAAASSHKALSLKPDSAEAHYNLGNALKELGRMEEAAASCHKALAIKPEFVEALNTLGNVLMKLGNVEEATASYRKALDIKPDYAEAHYNLGNAFIKLGKLDEAVASFHKTLAIEPDFVEAHINLGAALNELGRMEEAAASSHQALAIKPDSAEAHNNLGNALRFLGRMDEAVASYNKALDFKPNYVDAHRNLGLVLTVLGRFVEAKAAIDQGFRIKHGGPWWNAATFADGDSADTAPPVGAISTSTFKLRDNVDQLEYLIAKGRIDPSFQCMADRYRAVLAEMQLREEPEALTKLTPSQQERLGSFYNRVIHYAEAPRIGTGTINESLDFKQIEDRYISSPVSVTTIDDFLTPEALRGLRDFCLESTIFFAGTSNYFVQSRLTEGFHCDLLYQTAEEVKERFPRILGGHHLANMWIYRYNNQSVGVAAHTDKGAVTFNLWITPDDANRIPDRGGIIVYTKEQPYDWDWRYYNTEKYTPAVSREIADFLADADTVTIPYHENRAVLFHSNLFHKSDQIHFRDGFQNRRMNITLLYGRREDRSEGHGDHSGGGE